MGLLVLQYQNCSTYNDPSPFELQDPSLVNIAPGKVVLDSPSDPAYLTETAGLSDGHFTVQMEGTCNVGLEAADHVIDLELYRLDNGSTYNRILTADRFCEPLNANAACIRSVKCEHGKYHILISGQRNTFCPTSFDLVTQLKIKGQIVLFDAQGGPTSPRSGQFEKTFVFAKLSTICNP